MTSLNNLEKLIQMATIEHMYSMLQKMSNNNLNLPELNIPSSKHQNFNDQRFNVQSLNEKSFNDKIVNDKNLQTDTYASDIKNITDLLEVIKNNNQQNVETIVNLVLRVKQLEDELSNSRLLMRVNNLEEDLNQIRSNTNNNSKYLCQQIRGQQVLTSYPGFSNQMAEAKPVEEEHIKLKIEEKLVTEIVTVNQSDELEEEEEEEEAEEEEEEEELEDEEEEEDEELEEEEEEKPPLLGPVILNNEMKQVFPKEEVEEEEEGTEEEEEEEEVCTEEEVDLEIAPVQTKEIVVVTEEEEEEEEEVFEIEIDDVTYFATHEENGILYEITSDGDVGKKVGIIKDGEPIFK
jgi:hypothetical protein